MAEPIQTQIKRALQTVEGLYYRLVLLVGQSRTGKTGVLREVADELGSEVININLALSTELLELTAKQRVLHLKGILEKIVDMKTQPLVLLDNIEILFDKELKQDPLRLLQGISRNRSVVASWNGAINENKLHYAETGHPEYRNYELADFTAVNMGER